MINWIKKNKVEVCLVVFITTLALFLRLYRIDEFLTFLGDEGRDVRIVRDLITKGNLVFIGPQTSIGNMYLGPLYYYMMAPSLFLSRLNPVGPAVMVALLGTITVFLTYYFGKRWFGLWAGIVSAFLYAISPVAIIYSRSSWNPNPMPLFALLSIWGIYKVYKENKFVWLPILGLTFASALQMHYLGLLLAPTLLLFWFIKFMKIRSQHIEVKRFLILSAAAIFIFLVMMSPLALFDLKHQGMNLNAFKAFFSDRQTTVNLNPARSDRFLPTISTTISDLVLARQNIFPLFVAVTLAILFYLYSRKQKDRFPSMLLVAWIGFGLLGLSLYKQHVYVHYLGFFYPAIYLLTGASLSFLITKNFPKCLPGAILLTYLAYLNLSNSPTFTIPGRQLQRTEAVANLVVKESQGQPFNFGLIAKQNYDESYRYFLENKTNLITKAEDKITDQLFVVCEDGDTCAPLGHSQWQIAIFGIAQIQNEWRVDHLRVYRLVHPRK